VLMVTFQLPSADMSSSKRIGRAPKRDTPPHARVTLVSLL
jgi:hypothetical protein